MVFTEFRTGACLAFAGRLYYYTDISMPQEKIISRRQLVSFFFIALLVFIVYNVLMILWPFFPSIFWASVLTFAFYPTYETVLKKTRRPTVAAMLMTAAVLLLIVPLALVLIFALAEELVKFYRWASAFFEDGRFQQLMTELRSLPLVHKIERQLERLGAFKNGSQSMVIGQASSLAEFAGRQTGELTKNVLFFFIHFLLTFFLLFFFFKDGARIYRFIYEATPLEEKYKKEIFRQLDDTFNAVLRGQLVTSLVQAALTGLVFWALGLPVPLLLAAITFVVALIPVFGAATVWFPFVVYLALIGDYGRAIVLLAIGTLVISLVDNVLKPILIGEKTKLPYFLLFLGILGGLQVYGLIGIFVAPAVLSIFFVLVKIYREKFLEYRD